MTGTGGQTPPARDDTTAPHLEARHIPAGHVSAGRVAAGYGLLVLGTAAVLHLLSGPARTRSVLAVSTDPDALLQHPLRSLALSAFVVPTTSGLALVPAAAAALWTAQRRYGRWVAVVTALAGHALVSVAVAALLERGDDPPTFPAAADVGVSYVLAISAGLTVVALPRAAAVTGVVVGTAVTVALLAVGPTSTDAGHLLAWTIGVAVGPLLLRRAAHKRPLGGPPGGPRGGPR